MSWRTQLRPGDVRRVYGHASLDAPGVSYVGLSVGSPADSVGRDDITFQLEGDADRQALRQLVGAILEAIDGGPAPPGPIPWFEASWPPAPKGGEPA